MHNFRELKVWQRAMDFTSNIYLLTQHWPTEERYGLTSQIRRAATSIALNIAERSGSGSDKEFARFLHISLRSTYEVMAAIEIAQRLSYLQNNHVLTLNQEADEIAAMLVGLIRKIKPTS